MKKTCSILILCLLLLAALSGCVDSTKPPEKAQYEDITVQRAKEMIDRGEVFILDVRTQEEYDAGHIKGSTRIPVQDIPAQELDEAIAKIPRDRKLLVYCRTARRSAQASEILVNNGFAQVYNMKGGIVEWTKAGYEVVK
ncbi:MAG: rhodanese-like domain-containing protein [Candidatus Methanoperedens sp.]|nr:rhodanese-like domain-containing protein [Candidatus Methanoperedens sp.]